MTSILSQALAASGQIGVLVHLGAGSGEVLADEGLAHAGQVILVEADPGKVRHLETRAAEMPQVRVIAAAVGPADGIAAFRLFNLGTQSSLRAPTDLRLLYPGLRQLGTPEVEVISPASLVARLPAAGEVPDLLVIDCPGEEETVILGLQRAGALERFASVVLACGTTPHYEGAATADQLGQRLEMIGYRLVSEDDSDPDQPIRLYRLEGLWLENKRLAAEVADQTRRAAAAEAAAHEAQAQADERTTQIAALGTEVADQTRRAAAAEAAAHEAQAQADERTTQIAALETDVAAQKKRAEAAEAAAREAAARADARGTQIATLETDVAAQKKRAEAAEGQNLAQRQKLQELEHKIRLARDDLHRAEGQIGLIKSLLLRGDGL